MGWKEKKPKKKNAVSHFIIFCSFLIFFSLTCTRATYHTYSYCSCCIRTKNFLRTHTLFSSSQIYSYACALLFLFSFALLGDFWEVCVWRLSGVVCWLCITIMIDHIPRVCAVRKLCWHFGSLPLSFCDRPSTIIIATNQPTAKCKIIPGTKISTRLPGTWYVRKREQRNHTKSPFTTTINRATILTVLLPSQKQSRLAPLSSISIFSYEYISSSCTTTEQQQQQTLRKYSKVLVVNSTIGIVSAYNV